MAAILPFLEEERDVAEAQSSGEESDDGLAGLDGLTLKRIGPGAYESADGAWEIAQQNGGFWIVRSKTDRSDYSDPVRTLALAKGWLQRTRQSRGDALGDLGANPPGVKVRKGPDYDFDGEWIVSYRGFTLRMHFSPELPRGWNLILPAGAQRTRSGFGSDLLTMDSKAEALALIVKKIDAQDPWIQPYLTHSDSVSGFGDGIVVVEGDVLPPEVAGGSEVDGDLVVVEGFGKKSPEETWPKLDPVKATIEANHASLTRFVWNRSLVEDHLRSCKYWVETDREKGFVFRIDKELPVDVLPWKMISGSASRATFRFFGEGNGKMACPAWDLPAGPSPIGGTCPGAAAAQTIVPVAIRKAHLTKVDPDHPEAPVYLKAPSPGVGQVVFREAATICSACYAGEGNFGYGEKFAELALRYLWTRVLLQTPEGTEEWITTMTAAVQALSIPVAEDRYSEAQIRPIRVHSSGDFFSPAYAEAWMEVANRVWDHDPSIKFWCPSRTWAAPGKHGGHAFDWPSILRRLKHPNLIVRASAYHVGDAAPEGLTTEGANGWAKGTTALVAPLEDQKVPGAFHLAFPEAIWQGEDDPRRDHDCPVYALKKADEKGSCEVAGCRVCWNVPGARVNYALH